MDEITSNYSSKIVLFDYTMYCYVINDNDIDGFISGILDELKATLILDKQNNN